MQHLLVIINITVTAVLLVKITTVRTESKRGLQSLAGVRTHKGRGYCEEELRPDHIKKSRKGCQAKRARHPCLSAVPSD